MRKLAISAALALAVTSAAAQGIAWDVPTGPQENCPGTLGVATYYTVTVWRPGEAKPDPVAYVPVCNPPWSPTGQPYYAAPDAVPGTDCVACLEPGDSCAYNLAPHVAGGSWLVEIEAGNESGMSNCEPNAPLLISLDPPGGIPGLRVTLDLVAQVIVTTGGPGGEPGTAHLQLEGWRIRAYAGDVPPLLPLP